MLGLFLVAAAAELVAVAADLTVLQWIAKPLLALSLIGYLLRAGRRDLVTVALVLACAGDVVLLARGQTWFLVGMVFFLGTQICLLVAFLRRSRPRWPTFVIGGLFWLTANALLWNHLGGLRVPILLYSLALVAMAAAATGHGRRVGAGAVLFVVSDLLIGLRSAGFPLPAHDVLVMSTYAAALALIATGWANAPEPANPID
ncbi:lysoplasmalogenase [Actinoplanes sp. NPDC089786]|uniref:lysoplasmalogenase n=1 Tax=Actinoplanes sp. NPDC089786 TaxID=3155185 RepID=UPI0034464E85